MKTFLLILVIVFSIFAVISKNFQPIVAHKKIAPKFWDTIPHLDIAENRIWEIDFNAQSLLLSVGKLYGVIEVFDATAVNKKITIKTNKVSVTVSANKQKITNLTSSANGKLLASSTSYFNSTTKIWDPITGENIVEIPNTRGPEVFSNDDDIIYMASDNALLIYDILNHEFFPVKYSVNGIVSSLGLSQNGKYLAVGGAGKIQIWQINKKYAGLLFWKKLESTSLELVSEKTIHTQKDRVRSIEFSQDNKKVFAISWIGGLDVLEAPLLTNRRHNKPKYFSVKTANYIKSEQTFIIIASQGAKPQATSGRLKTGYLNTSSLQDDHENFTFNGKCAGQFPHVFKDPTMAFTKNIEYLFYLGNDGDIEGQARVEDSEDCYSPPTPISICDKKFIFIKSPDNRVSEDGFTVFYDGTNEVVLPSLVQKALEKQKNHDCHQSNKTSLNDTVKNVDYAKNSFIQKKKQDQALQTQQLELINKTLQLNVEGESLYVQKQYDAASQIFEEVIRLDSRNARAYNNLAIVSLKQGNKNKAITLSDRVINSFPVSAKEKAAALFNMGLACENTGIIMIAGPRRSSAVAHDQKIFCYQDSLLLYTRSYITSPSSMRAELILKQFTNAKEANNHCQLNDGLYQSYFKDKENYIFLHSKQEADFLSDFTQDSNNNLNKTIRLKETATGQLPNGLYITTYFSPNPNTITLDEKACDIFIKEQQSDLTPL